MAPTQDRLQGILSGSPETIVFGVLGYEVPDDPDTPRIDQPKTPTETETHQNLCATVFGELVDERRPIPGEWRMSIVGYARVSTRDQNPAAQEAELRAAGAGRVFVDHGESSRVSDRSQWTACLDYLRPGDTLVVRALDRVAGSEVMAIELIRDLARRGIRLRSLTEPFLDVDTSTPMGEAIVGIMAVLAQLRVSTIRDNTRRGLEHARSQGRVGGRPSVMSDERTAAAVQMRGNGDSVAKIGRTLGVGASSVARALDRYDRERVRQAANDAETPR